MNRSFAPLRSTLPVLALFALCCSAGLAAPTSPQTAEAGGLPPSGKDKVCHGYVRHVSTTNMRVHCIDGRPSDQSFLYVPRFAKLTSGKSVQTSELQPDTPVVIYYSQDLLVKKADRIFVTDTNGNPTESVHS
jgi:hypothetical protein